jgi:hypothetical protein
MDNSKLQLPSKNNLFYSEEDFFYETDLVERYIEEDLNQSVVLYEVDRKKTNVNTIYKEATKGNIRYKAPKEIPCMYEIKDSETKSFDSKSSTGIYQQDGNLVIYVLVKTLEKYKADIKRGDYIGVQIDTNRMTYYNVVNDGKVNTANTHMIGGYKPAWRTIECTLVSDISEFNG